MLIESVVIGGTLLSSGALLIDEKNIDIYKHGKEGMAIAKRAVDSYINDVLRECFRENSYVKAILEARESKEKEIKVAKQSEAIREYEKQIDMGIKILGLHGAGCYGSNSNSLSVWGQPDDLSALRKILRNVLGRWSDKISDHYCAGEMLTVYYKGTHWHNFDITISIDYPLDDLPDGILKPGCKVIRETQAVSSCRIECAI